MGTGTDANKALVLAQSACDSKLGWFMLSVQGFSPPHFSACWLWCILYMKRENDKEAMSLIIATSYVLG